MNSHEYQACFSSKVNSFWKVFLLWSLSLIFVNLFLPAPDVFSRFVSIKVIHLIQLYRPVFFYSSAFSQFPFVFYSVDMLCYTQRKRRADYEKTWKERNQPTAAPLTPKRRILRASVSLVFNFCFDHSILFSSPSLDTRSDITGIQKTLTQDSTPLNFRPHPSYEWDTKESWGVESLHASLPRVRS